MQNSPTPTSPLRAAIIEEIEILDQHDERRGTKTPCQSALLRFVLEHGREFAGRARPKGIRRMAMKACFRNSYLLASIRDLIYVEGFATSKDMPLFHHAWCIDTEAQVIDATLEKPQDFSYFGVPLRFKFAHSRMIDGRWVTPALAREWCIFLPPTKEDEPFVYPLGEDVRPGAGEGKGDGTQRAKSRRKRQSPK